VTGDVPGPNGSQPGGTPREPQPSRLALGPFVSLQDVLSALRRRRRFLLLMAAAGLLVPLALVVVAPPKRSATTTLFLTHRSGDDPNLDMTTDVALLQTAVVAQRAVDRLGMHVPAQALLSQYRGVADGVAILQITATGSSSSQAVQRADAVAGAFLQVRNRLLESQEQAVTKVLAGQVAELQSEVSQLSGAIDASSPASSQAAAAVAQRNDDLTQIADIQQTMQSGAVDTQSVVDSSKVLVTATAAPLSRVKGPATDAGAGMLAGLALGAAVVTVGAIASDRMRRREDFAAALGTPVELSVGRTRSPRWWAGHRLRRRLGGRDRNVQSMERHLRSCLLLDPRPRLAVVSIDSLETSACALASLAGTLAREGARVLLVDLSDSAFLGRMLGVRQAGTEPSPVTVAGQSVLLLVPADEVVSTLFTRAGEIHPRPPSEPTADRFSDSVVLVLVTVGPETGPRRLAAWTSNAVFVVTAGRSRPTRVRADAELARSAGLDPRSAILVGADGDDDSPGTVERPPRPGQDVRSTGGLRSQGVIRP